MLMIFLHPNLTNKQPDQKSGHLHKHNLFTMKTNYYSILEKLPCIDVKHPYNYPVCGK